MLQHTNAPMPATAEVAHTSEASRQESELVERSDNELITAHRNGEKLAFKVLVNRYEGKLYSHALDKIGNFDKAEDIVQSVFMSLFEQLSNDDFQPSNLNAFLHTCVGNLSTDIYRKMKRQPASSLGNRDGESDYDVPDRQTLDPSDSVVAFELSRKVPEALYAAIDELFPAQKEDQPVTRASRTQAITREIIFLRLEGKELKEIAEAMDIPLNSVKSKLYGAIEVKLFDFFRRNSKYLRIAEEVLETSGVLIKL